MEKRASEHEFVVGLIWEGNTGLGTSNWRGYERRHRIRVRGKADLEVSADPAFLGESDRHNPEELFLASIGGCHMLFYLALCSRHQVRVLAYADDVRGSLVLTPDGGGRFDAITLSPRMTIAEGDDLDLASALHDTAHERCFIANSCSAAIRIEPLLLTERVRGSHAATPLEHREAR